MESLIKELIEQFGYVGIFLLIALENVFPPIPSEVILTFGGYMTHGTTLSIVGVIIASTLGSIAGALILYRLGRLLDVERLGKIIERYGRFLRLTNVDVTRANTWFHVYGIWTVLFCRLIPLLRSLISIPAGMAKMNFWMFLLFSTLGTLVWNTVLVNIGAQVGAESDNIMLFMDKFSHVAYIAILLFFLLGLGWYAKSRRRKI